MHSAHADRILASVASGQDAARSAIAASWARCYGRHRLDPARPGPVPVLPQARLSERREARGRLLALARPRLEELHRTVVQGGRAVLLADRDGTILDELTRPADAGAFREAGLAAGADWSEAAQGTNGIGTCLAEARALIVDRDQHYLPQNTEMSCIDAPVFGPEGELVAALDVSTARADETEAMNRLIAAAVAQAAARIETDLFRDRHAGCRIVLAEGGDDLSALLAVDRDEIVVGATRAARRGLGLAASGPIRPLPLGDLTGESAGGLRGAERAELMRALTRAEGNVSAAARTLGVGRATLYRRMKRLGFSETGGDLSRH